MIDLSTRYDHYRRRLVEAMRARNLTNEELAGRTESHPATITKLRSGRIRLDDEWRAKMAAGIGLTDDVLFGSDPLPAPKPSEIFQPLKKRGRKPRAANDNAVVSVYGMAAASIVGHYVMSEEVIDRVPCPPALVGVEGVYALRVIGESMVPRYMPNDVLYVDQNQKVEPGDHIVIQVRTHTGAGTETWIKRYDGLVDDEIVVTQYKPEARMRFKRQYVEHIHRVLPINELFVRR